MDDHNNDTADPLAELKDIMHALSPQDLAAWAATMEGRLMERLRRRQESGLPPPSFGATAPPDSTTTEEDHYA